MLAESLQLGYTGRGATEVAKPVIGPMPANLTQQYLKAEENYRRATTLEEELQCLQVMMKEIPKHKGTDHLQAELKSKIAKLKRELVTEKSSGN